MSQDNNNNFTIITKTSYKKNKQNITIVTN